jgi:hypothetical protein
VDRSSSRGVLEPVVERYRERDLRRYFRGDAAFAAPDIYEFLEAEGYKYTIRLKANAILQQSIAYLLTRPVGRPPNHVVRTHASFSYQAGSWDNKRRVVAKVEWHPGELVPRVGFIVTNLTRPARRVVAFYNHRGTAEQQYRRDASGCHELRQETRERCALMTRIGAITSRGRLGSARAAANPGDYPPARHSALSAAATKATMPPETGVHLENVG